MRNPLQEQLLKAGLVKKGQVAQVEREQARRRQGKAPSAPDPAQVAARRLQAEKAERDRALAAERNAQARQAELRAQAGQIVATNRVAGNGDSAYHFADGGVIRSLTVDTAQRGQLARGALVIVRDGDGHALLPRAAADRVRERDAGLLVVDHGQADASADEPEVDDHYRRFQVPDDLVW
ncbi:MAG: DUF2058 domain-containing protein [Xanthomonadales bacterium]|nr:DUF2058 domain-containing protein [Xanthomonadales bacterium]